MIGEAEAYAAADSLLGRYGDKNFTRARVRKLLALAYADGLTDGKREEEDVDFAAFLRLAQGLAL